MDGTASLPPRDGDGLICPLPAGLQPLAALAHFEQDDALAALCARHLESWVDNNPLFKGVHWAAGIEASLRIITMLVLNTLIGERAFSPELKTKVLRSLVAHAYWVSRYPSRFSSANNHLIAEGAACFLLGTLAPGLKGSPRWAISIL